MSTNGKSNGNSDVVSFGKVASMPAGSRRGRTSKYIGLAAELRKIKAGSGEGLPISVPKDRVEDVNAFRANIQQSLKRLDMNTSSRIANDGKGTLTLWLAPAAVKVKATSKK
jgi:hypothetical protein